MTVKTKQMDTPSGNPAANQFIIYTDDGRYFQSYSSKIVFIERNTGKVFLDERFWDYSVTTGKYRNMFLGETKKETAAKINRGEYTLMDLN